MSKIRAMLRSAVRAGHTPGLVAMATNSDAIIYSGAYGRHSMTESRRMAKNTIFRSLSLLKPVMTVAALQLADHGALDLDDRVDALVPEVTTPAPSARQQVPSHAGGAPSIRQLLSRIADPDTAVNDTSIRWTGLAIQRASGEALESFVRRGIFQPLSMRDSYFTLPAALWTRVAGVHREAATGVVKPVSFSTAVPIASYGQNSFYSTAPNSLTLLRAILRRDSKLLSPQGHQELILTRPPKLRTNNALIYRDFLNTYCWVDSDAGTAGVLFTQRLDHSGQPMRGLFSKFRAAMGSESNKTSKTSRIAHVLEHMNPFPDRTIWYI